MAKFHVGQRVRRVGGGSLVRVGSEGTVTRIEFDGWVSVLYDGADNPAGGGGPSGSWISRPQYLTPLTDPYADRFIESIKKLGREPINDAPKVEVTK